MTCMRRFSFALVLLVFVFAVDGFLGVDSIVNLFFVVGQIVLAGTRNVVFL